MRTAPGGRRSLTLWLGGVACILLCSGSSCGTRRTGRLVLPVDAVESVDPVTGAWQTHAAFAPLHPVGLTAVIGSQLIAVAEISTEVSGYDPALDTWTPLAPLPAPSRYLGTGLEVQGLLVIVGGYISGATSRVDVYDPVADQWRQGANMPAAFIESSRFAVAGGRLHALAETYPTPNGPPPANEHAAYDPVLDQWESLPPLPNPRFSGSWVSDGATLYLIGGQVSYDHTGMVAVDRYDPATRAWSVGADLQRVEPQPEVLVAGVGDLVVVGKNGAQRLGPSGWRQVNSPQANWLRGPGVVLGNQVYGYEEISDTQGQPISFDLTREVWQRHGFPPTNRVGPELFAHQGQLYVGLGFQIARYRPRLP